MSSPQPGPSKTPPSYAAIDSSDIANYKTFMESLVTFMNESFFTVQQVKERSGSSVGCTAPVKMNDEEKQQKMNEIVCHLSEKYTTEASSLYTTANETAYHTALESAADESAHNTAFSIPSSPSQFRPKAASTPCSCPPDVSSNLTPPSRYSPRGRRADTPRPGTTPVRGKVATPDQYFVPLTQSSINSPQTAGCPAATSPSFGTSRGASRVGARSQSPYSTLIDSGGPPYAYRSGTPAFEGLTTQSGRGLSSYSNNPSSDWGSGCPPQCSIGSVNSTGRQQYRTLKGPQSNWEWKQENRTI